MTLKSREAFPESMPGILVVKKSALSRTNRAFIALGSLLIIAFLLAIGPYLSGQKLSIWAGFGLGALLIACGTLHSGPRWISASTTALGMILLGAMVFAVFGLAHL